jgi:hypothetical protein
MVTENPMALTFLSAFGAFSALGVFIIFLIFMSRKRQELFETRFPPISDAEFIARCAPGVRPEVALKVRRIVADNLGIQYERIHPSSRFVQDLGTG